MAQPQPPVRDDLNGGNYAVDDGNDMSDAPPIPEFLRPSRDYITPSSSALFGHLTAVPVVQKLLPSSWICDFLKNAYFTNVHPIASCLHQPTFEQQFSEFLILVDRGRQPRRPRQALVFAVLFSGVVAADESAIAAQLNVRKVDLVALVKYGVEASLGRANLLRTTSVEAMQAFVIYLVRCAFLCRVPFGATRASGFSLMPSCRLPFAATRSRGRTPSSSAPPSAWPSAWPFTVTGVPLA